MFLMRKVVLALMLLLAPAVAVAQVDDAIEQWVVEQEGDAAAAEMSDLLLHYVDNPANLNDTASLSRLPFLSPFQVRALQNYIILYGQLVDVSELRMVPGFDSLTVARIAPLVTAAPFVKEPVPSLGEMIRRGRHSLVAGLGGTVEQAAGYSNGHYDGDNLRMLLCYRFSYCNHVELQLSGDKDPAEAWGRGNFYGYSLALRDIGRLKVLVLGRYNVQFGQGVALWTGFAPFSLTGMSPVRFARGLKAASAFNETGWQQGVATTVRVGRGLELSAFGSRGGQEWLGGTHLTLRRDNLVAGVTLAAVRLDDSLSVRDYAYNQDYFRGDRAGVVGADVLWQAGRLLLFAEGAFDDGGRPAIFGGARLSMGDGNSLGVAVRHYHPRYHAIHADAPALVATRNEEGVCLTAQLRLPFRVTALMSADVYRHPSLRYGSYAPSAGTWLRLQLGRAVGRHGEATLRLALRGAQRNVPGSDSVAYEAEETLRGQLQGQWRHTSGAWRFTTRAIVSWFDAESGGRNRGWLIAQEVRYARRHWQAILQAAWHDIDGYYARIALSESNLQYAFSIPMLQGEGLRLAAVLRGDLTRHVNLALKYTLTARPGELAIGSGDAATSGALRQTWHVQMRLKL